MTSARWQSRSSLTLIFHKKYQINRLKKFSRNSEISQWCMATKQTLSQEKTYIENRENLMGILLTLDPPHPQYGMVQLEGSSLVPDSLRREERKAVREHFWNILDSLWTTQWTVFCLNLNWSLELGMTA